MTASLRASEVGIIPVHLSSSDMTVSDGAQGSSSSSLESSSESSSESGQSWWRAAYVEARRGGWLYHERVCVRASPTRSPTLRQSSEHTLTCSTAMSSNALQKNMCCAKKTNEELTRGRPAALSPAKREEVSYVARLAREEARDHEGCVELVRTSEVHGIGPSRAYPAVGGDVLGCLYQAGGHL